MRVLIVEDDRSLGELLTRVLHEEGATCTWCADATSGLSAADPPSYDAIVLDWMLPDLDGPTFCEALRARNNHTPILMLTARREVPDRVTGLRSGADDYLGKPFEVEELLARLHALVRRNHHLGELRFGDLVIDRTRRRCMIRDAPVEITTRELDLLFRLVAADGATVSRSVLLSDVWNLRFDPGSGLLDVHVSRLRDKLGEHASKVETVRGVGYRWAAKP